MVPFHGKNSKLYSLITFPVELREAKMMELMNLKQDFISVREYSHKFTNLSKYDPTLVDDLRANKQI